MTNTKVTVRDNGPLLLTGFGVVEDAEGSAFDTGGKETIALCRCGASKNRPFCDGFHRECNFEAVDRVTDK
ncbi:MAG: CDGSH iron-sulfur domain-containing protein [Fuerstiella sp.]|nr:CDGSH iron-sulfur domain-containing protein [Fuerstiella sp.]